MKHLASRVGEKTREKGAAHVITSATRWALSPLLTPVYKWSRKDWQFNTGDRAYPYFVHRYNMTWRNERAIEVPIAFELIQQARGKRILEVGNVLSHYFDFEHDVLDKYENAPGVFAQDVVDFKPSAPYDLIISISTLEHVGWDETPRDAGKVPRAVAAMRSWLAPGGQMLVTVPIGYNDYLDEHLKSGSLRFDENRYFKRTTRDNQWQESSWDELVGAKYGEPYADSSCHMLFGTNRAPL